MARNTSQTNIQLLVGKNTKIALKKLAIDEGLSLSDFVRQLAQEALNARGIKIDMKEDIGIWGSNGRDEE